MIHKILVSREFWWAHNLQTEVTLGILEGGMKFLAKYFSIPYPWGLLTCKNWGQWTEQICNLKFKNVGGKNASPFRKHWEPGYLCCRLEPGISNALLDKMNFSNLLRSTGCPGAWARLTSTSGWPPGAWACTSTSWWFQCSMIHELSLCLVIYERPLIKITLFKVNTRSSSWTTFNFQLLIFGLLKARFVRFALFGGKNFGD